MNTQLITIDTIPAMLWGEERQKLIIAVHGSHSSKSDIPIALLAEVAVPLGYRVLSFDLPGHGARQDDPTPCEVRTCIKELERVLAYGRTLAPSITLFGVSLGAYFSLMTFGEQALERCLLLSPVVDMEALIHSMMGWFSVSEEQLEKERVIPTPMGETLDWGYYQFVKAHPIKRWDTPTSILWGEGDELTPKEVITAFSERFGAHLEAVPGCGHYFHTQGELAVYQAWLEEKLSR